MTTVEILLSLLGLVGVGGIVSAIMTKQKELSFKILENKEKRYKSCLLYMDVYFEPENIKYLSSRQHDIHSQKDVIEYLKAEYHEMLLYASPQVVLAVKAFISAPTHERFLETVLAMRKDLWPTKGSLSVEQIKLPRGST
jgi:hypothetical protein